MPAFDEHLFVCGNQRSTGHPRGCCDPDGTDRLRNELKSQLKMWGLPNCVRVNKAGCLDQCEHGPVLVIYPRGIWYGGVTVEDVPRIIETTIINGQVLEDLVIAESCLNNPACEHIRPAKAPNPVGE